MPLRASECADSAELPAALRVGAELGGVRRPQNVTNEPTLAAGVGLESPTYTKTRAKNTTNEPTADGKNVTNERSFHRWKPNRAERAQRNSEDFDVHRDQVTLWECRRRVG